MADINLPPILISDFSSGVIRNVSKYKRPTNSVPCVINMVFDEVIGEAHVRKGTAMIGSQIIDNKSVLGLANFRDNGSSHALLAVLSDGTNNDIYKATAWSKSLENDTKDLKTRFAQFLDSIVRINGTDAAKSFDGSSWITTGGIFDLDNFPLTKYVKIYRDRVNVMGDDGILYTSSIPRFNLNYDAQTVNFNVGARLTGGTSGATAIIYKDDDSGATGTLQLLGVTGTFVNDETITDDAGGSATVNLAGQYKINWTDGYVTTPIDPDNGEKGICKGMGIVGGLMFIFFERAFYTWNGSATNPDPIASIGCSSNESIATCDGFMFFANKDGVYMSQGGFPQRISRFIQDLFDNMDTANYENIAGGCDGKHYYCSIGDVAIDGKTIDNVVLRFSIKSQEWTIYSMPTRPTVFSQYIDGTEIKLTYGDDDGNVIQIDSSDENDNYASTADAPIPFELQTYDIFNPLEGAIKTMYDRIFTHTEDSSGAKIYYRKDSNRNEDWKQLDEIKKDNQKIKIPSVKYQNLRFKIAGVSKVGRFKLISIDLPKINYNSF